MKNTWNNIRKFVKKNKWSIVVYIGMVFITYYLLTSFMAGQDTDEIKEITYPEFLTMLEAGDVDTVYYSTTSEYMTITLYNDETKDMPLEELQEYEYANADKRICIYPAYEEFRKDVLESGSNIRMIVDTSIWDVLTTLLSSAVSLFFFIFLFAMLKGSSKGIDEKDIIQTSDVKFDDIIGHDEIIDDVKFITELIKNPDMGQEVGAKMPKGLLFTGSPGTGKTLLAKAIAHEAGVPFLYQNASGFIEMYVGLGARRVRDLFKIAKKNAPCILFIDEIDAIGGKRGERKGTSENEQTINALLQEMDGFSGREGVFIIAATNRADSLDEALVRSGRFDRQITVNPPQDWTVRKKLFEHYLSKFAVSDEVDVDNFSKQVGGFTGADIAMICNEASIVAVMHGKKCIDNACIEEAIDKKVFKGNRSKERKHETDRKIIAYHESGHAIVSYLLGVPIARVSILSTISGVGGAVFNQDKDTLLHTENDLKNRVMIAYGGRASEVIKFNIATEGASNDITQATQILVQYIERLGFDKTFGLLDVSVLSREHLLNSDDILARLSKLSTNWYDECEALLRDNYDKVELLAEKLLEVETLSGEEVVSLLNKN